MAMHIKDRSILASELLPRSNKYDPQWIINNQMGLNPLWLTEWLCEKIPLTSGMRVLDLGCGKALSSIFLAEEYGVQVSPYILMRTATHLQKGISTPLFAQTPISTLGQTIST
jgi:SAM-dependent methyltransferase